MGLQLHFVILQTQNSLKY